MQAKPIQFFGTNTTLCCDGQCDKAWGMNNRPKVYFDENGEGVKKAVDYDDFAYLSDSELGVAPQDPGTYEGEDGKPVGASGVPGRMNKWCARECERSEMMIEFEAQKVPDFSVRSYNCQDTKEKVRMLTLIKFAGGSSDTIRWDDKLKTFIKL